MKETEELIPLNITDRVGNTIAKMPYNDNTICIDDIAVHLLTKFAQINAAIPILQGEIITLQKDMADLIEAFEHSDDSLDNLRHTVSAIKGNENE